MFPAPERPQPAALALVAVTFLVFGSLYAACAWLGDLATVRYRLFFRWEADIPLIPAAALVYLSISLMLIPLLLCLPTVTKLWPVVVTLTAQQAVAALCFWLLPLEDGFPPAPAVSGWSGGVWSLASRLALRHNYFPSLHVALSTSAALIVSRSLGHFSWTVHLWALAIALSTLLIHQHHLIDVVGGWLLAITSVRLIYDRMVPA